MTVKIVLCGSYGVGKTSLRRRIMGVNRFRRNYLPTVGSDFSYKEFNLPGHDYAIKTMIWDLAGEERFRSVRSLYFQGAHGALLVFDLTNRESFERLEEWIVDLENYTSTQGVPIYIIANKNDLILAPEEQAIPDKEIAEYVVKIQERYDDNFMIGYSKTSALSGENVERSFVQLIEEVVTWLPSRKIVR